jgi:hypothetical protein
MVLREEARNISIFTSLQIESTNPRIFLPSIQWIFTGLAIAHGPMWKWTYPQTSVLGASVFSRSAWRKAAAGDRVATPVLPALPVTTLISPWSLN